MKTQYGAPSGTRTHTPKNWFLRPARLPIPPSEHINNKLSTYVPGLSCFQPTKAPLQGSSTY